MPKKKRSTKMLYAQKMIIVDVVEQVDKVTLQVTVL